MVENKPKTNIVDTTDCFEAATVFKNSKNLFFAITLVCLLLLQACFWVNKLGWTDKDNCPCDRCSIVSDEVADAPLSESTSPVVKEANSADAPLLEKDPKAAAEAKKQADMLEALKEKEELLEQVDKQRQAIEQVAADVTSQPIIETTEEKTEADKTADETPARKLSFPKPNCYVLAAVVRVCNFVLIISATLYCLILLMSIKISLCGRLGGLAHISHAFFTSLFVLVILLPWQALFPGIVVGAVFTPAELFAGRVYENLPTVIGNILFYLRFPGMGLLAVVSLFIAQSRSAKWTRTIQRRLGMLH